MGVVVVCGVGESKQIKIREIEAFSVIKYCHQIHYKRPMGCSSSRSGAAVHRSLNIASLNLTAILVVVVLPKKSNFVEVLFLFFFCGGDGSSSGVS